MGGGFEGVLQLETISTEDLGGLKSFLTKGLLLLLGEIPLLGSDEFEEEEVVYFEGVCDSIH